METVLLELAAVVITIVVFLVLAGVTSRARERRAIDIYPPPGEGTDADVQRLIMHGEHLLAITLYREIHRVGMKEAKDAVDRLRDRYETS